ncbi:MAG: DNA polymerase III subunit gamma/tau [Kofleriaceae bacterium]|nr:DNA polymerase III subunit gamma/tau [Kofleriaceae bacterium]
MSYLVLARKYRPTTFSQVVGQEHVTRTLANAFASGRIHHAFLMTGPRGCGKTTVARIIGKALNCETMLGKGGAAGGATEPCGVCSACESIGNGSAVDYQEMDGASNRGIDAIRELTEAVRYQPAVLSKKVYVIDEVHMLTTEAFNALLKTLEEPPPHVTFVLATTEPHKLPNTILSRCQRYDFKLVPAPRLAQHLTSIFKQESLKIDAGAVSLLVRESGGSVRDALSLCDQIISYVGDSAITEAHVAEVLGVADRTLTRTLVRALATGDAGAALAAVESAIERGVDEVQLARAIVRYLRDLSVLQVAPNKPELVDASDEERTELAGEAKAIERTRVTQMFERMLRCCDELGKTLQPRLVLDCALIDVATVEPLVPLGDLIDRLGELEARLAGHGVRPSGGGGGGGGRSQRPPQGEQRPPSARASSASSAAATSSAAPASNSGASTAPALNVASGSSAASGSRVPPASSAASGSAAPAPAAAAAPPRASAPAPQAARSGEMAPAEAVPTATSTANGSGPHDANGAPRSTIQVPRDANEALRAWNMVLEELENRKKFSISGPFSHARVMKWTVDTLELGFPVEVHAMGEMAADTQTIEALRLIVRDLGPELKGIKVSVRMLDAAESGAAGVRSVLETTRDRSQAERIRREAEAREHPITKHVLQTFGAQIKEIKTDV